PAAEEMLDMRRQQKAVVAIELLGIGAQAPGFDVAGSQMSAIHQAGDAAGTLQLLDIRAERTQSVPGLDQRPLLAGSDVAALRELLLDALIRHLAGRRQVSGQRRGSR